MHRVQSPISASTRHGWRRAVLCAATLAMGAAADAVRAQGSIVMRPSARVAESAAVTLADVATLDGPDAAALAATVVLAAHERRESSIDVDRVRAAIDAAAGPRGVNWGRLTLSGGSCAILAAPAAPRPVPPARPEPVSGATVRAIVEERLHLLLGVDRVHICFIHDAEWTRFEDVMAPGGVMEILQDYKRKGVIGALGIAAGPVELSMQYVQTGMLDLLLTHNRYTLLNRSADAVQKEAIHKNGLLNDVAACAFIKGRSMEKLGNRPGAVQAYKFATQLSYGRCWDPDQGSFWSPAASAAGRLKMIQ